MYSISIRTYARSASTAHVRMEATGSGSSASSAGCSTASTSAKSACTHASPVAAGPELQLGRTPLAFTVDYSTCVPTRFLHLQDHLPLTFLSCLLPLNGMVLAFDNCSVCILPAYYSESVELIMYMYITIYGYILDYSYFKLGCLTLKLK